MKLPEVRDALHEISDDLLALSEKIKKLSDETRKRPARRKAPAKSHPVTPELIKKITHYANENPSASQFEIGRKFNVNQGRVSEVLMGKRQ